jgi:hypothetical protein
MQQRARTKLRLLDHLVDAHQNRSRWSARLRGLNLEYPINGVTAHFLPRPPENRSSSEFVHLSALPVFPDQDLANTSGMASILVGGP